MAVIWIGSTGLLSEHRTSRFIGPILRWIVPGVTDTTVHRVQFLVRKGAHLTEYAILALLVQRAILRSNPARREARSLRVAALAAGICVLYAATDEAHQGFVATRNASAWDVLLDAAGAVAGLSGRLLAGRKTGELEKPAQGA
jgi:VanZ family protein